MAEKVVSECEGKFRVYSGMILDEELEYHRTWFCFKNGVKFGVYRVSGSGLISHISIEIDSPDVEERSGGCRRLNRILPLV